MSNHLFTAGGALPRGSRELRSLVTERDRRSREVVGRLRRPTASDSCGIALSKRAFGSFEDHERREAPFERRCSVAHSRLLTGAERPFARPAGRRSRPARLAKTCSAERSEAERGRRFVSSGGPKNSRSLPAVARGRTAGALHNREPHSTARALGARSLRSLLASLARLALDPPGTAPRPHRRHPAANPQSFLKLDAVVRV